MAWRDELMQEKHRWRELNVYQKFEHAIILVLTGVIAVTITLAICNLLLKVAASIAFATFDPSDYSVFQCTGCHGNNNANGFQHPNVSGYVYNSVNCYQCHKNGGGG